MRISLHARIFLGTTAVILSFVVVASWTLDRVVDGILVRELEEDLVGARNACERYLELKHSYLASDARAVVSQSPELAEELASAVGEAAGPSAGSWDGPEERARGLLPRLAAVVDGAGIFVADRDGRVLAGAELRGGYREFDSTQIFVGAPGEEAVWSGFGAWGGRPCLMGTAPVSFDGRVVGAVGVAEPVDPALAFALRDSSGRDVTIVWGGRIVASAWGDGLEDDALAHQWLAELDLGTADGRGTRLTTGDDEYVATALSLSGGTTIFLSRPIWTVLGPSRAARRNLFAAAGAVLLLALLVARGTAARLGQPVRDLVEAAKRLAGGDLESAVQIDGEDEVAQLGHQFNEMARQLRSLVERAMEKAQAAEAAAEAKAAFVTTMSHELRTPLNAVLGFASLLQDTALDDDQEEHVEAIRDSGQDLLQILSDILEFTDLRAGRSGFEESSFSVEALVRRATEPVMRLANSQGIELTTETGGVLPARLIGHGEAIQRLLGNYVDNALKFTDAGAVKVRLELVSFENGVALRGEVEDSGIGIAESDRGRVFDPFLQLDSSSSRRFGGTGLGLAICRNLAEMMGGNCGVESAFGEGSMFWFEVPVMPDLHANASTGNEPDDAVVVQTAGPGLGAGFPADPRKASEDSNALQPEPAAALPKAPSEGQGEREDMGQPTILVVEDNRLNQRLAGLVLRKAGWEFEVASHGREALERLSERRFDLVLMDCQMPVMDGFEATRRIRAEELGRGYRTPIVALTANAREADREACLAAGMDDFVAKPFQAQPLTATIRGWLLNSVG